MTRRVAVVGGGISGLAAALSVLDSVDRCPTSSCSTASRRLGGRIDTSPFAGVEHVDEGADAFLARVPEAVALARRVGLGDDLVSPEAVGAAVWHDGLHPIPDGLLLGVPGRLRPLATHRPAVVEGQGPCRARTVPAAHLDRERLDRRVRPGPVRQRGPRATRRLARRQHLRRRHRPVQPGRGPATRLLGRRQPESAAGRASTTSGAGHRDGRDQPDLRSTPRWHGIVDRRHRRRDHRRRGPVRDRSAPSRRSSPGPTDGGSVLTDADDDAASSDPFDAVIFATPARVTGSIVRATAPDASALLARAETADVIMVTLHVPADEWPDAAARPERLPRPEARPATWSRRRRSARRSGRTGGRRAAARSCASRSGATAWRSCTSTTTRSLAGVLADLDRHLGVGLLAARRSGSPAGPARSRSTARIIPRGSPRSRAALPSGLFVTGAGFRGIGIPACVRSGSKMAAQTSTHLRNLEESTP